MSAISLHPVIRVVSLIVFIAGMSVASPAVMLAGTLLLVLVFSRAGFPAMNDLVRMVIRLRWLYLAILVVYGWWTPGMPLMPGLETLSPSRQGMIAGLQRVAVLLLIVSAVHLLTRTTERSRLLAAVMVTTSPFLGRTLRERFAVRLLLTMEAVAPVRDIVGTALTATPSLRRGLEVTAGRVRAIYSGVLEHAGQAAGRPVEIHALESPPPLQWLVPLSLFAGFLLLHANFG